MHDNIRQKFVLIEGLGFSGSGAVLDLLREVDNCFVMPTEFRLINDPDGLLSLERALIDNWTVFQGDTALKRFRSLCNALTNKFSSPYSTLNHKKIFSKEFLPAVDRYLNKLTKLEFNGLWYGNDTYLRRKLIGRRFIGRNKFTTRKMYLANDLKEDEFYKYTSDFLIELASLCISEKRANRIVIDGDYSVLNAKSVLNYFPSGKMILVIRDPRDILATVRKGMGAFIPNEFRKNIQWQLSIYNRLIKNFLPLSKKQCLIIRFEDMICNYDEIRKGIFSFLNIDAKTHNNKYQYFNPKYSKKNVGIWTDCLTIEESDLVISYFEDINKIIKVIH
jgi:hypothetical protein